MCVCVCVCACLCCCCCCRCWCVCVCCCVVVLLCCCVVVLLCVLLCVVCVGVCVCVLLFVCVCVVCVCWCVCVLLCVCVCVVCVYLFGRHLQRSLKLTGIDVCSSFGLPSRTIHWMGTLHTSAPPCTMFSNSPHRTHVSSFLLQTSGDFLQLSTRYLLRLLKQARILFGSCFGLPCRTIDSCLADSNASTPIGTVLRHNRHSGDGRDRKRTR